MGRYDFVRVLKVVLLASVLYSAGCNNENGGPSTPPGPGNVMGKITGTISGGPIAGSTVRIGGAAATTTSNGDYIIPGSFSGVVGINVDGPSQYPRQVTKDLSRSLVANIDVIEKTGAFSLQFYRQLVRDAEESLFLRPTNRWEGSEPTFFIDTSPEIGTGAPIPSSTVDTVKSVIRQSMPVFTKGFITGSRITVTSNPPAELTSGTIIIKFDHTILQRGAFGVTRTQTFGNRIDAAVTRLVLNPNFPFDELTSHELGHAVGFFHASDRPSVMVAVGSCGCGLFTQDDQVHMKINYSRPAGNTDIDNDPPDAITKSLAKREVIEIVCRK
ncbi:MAG TPA: hypothetical protein VNM22_00185 [Candidatus Limnocylindrales bacterium]|nr:hypothetical protein [Candidatus Limnocylindrales bacterium]